MCEDLNDHPFAIFMAGERIPSEDDEWEAWVREVESILGFSLDGNQERDGYSIDFAHDAFREGVTAAEYAREVEG